MSTLVSRMLASRLRMARYRRAKAANRKLFYTSTTIMKGRSMSNSSFVNEDLGTCLLAEWAVEVAERQGRNPEDNIGVLCDPGIRGSCNIPLDRLSEFLHELDLEFGDDSTMEEIAISSNEFIARSNVLFCKLTHTQHAIKNYEVYIKDLDFNRADVADLFKKFNSDKRELTFHWIYDNDGTYATVTTEVDKQVSAVLYPQIPNFDTFFERFWNSKSSILILQGPPGTGKTSLIQALAEYTGKTTFVTYDSKILDNDRSFANFIETDDAGMFVIEDADLLMSSRKDGNNMVARFLNIGDGLISMKNKKLVFSTNLQSTSEIDPALMRPGRLFGMYNLGALTKDQAVAVCEEYGLEFKPKENTNQGYTLAELFSTDGQVKQETARKTGFY